MIKFFKKHEYVSADQIARMFNTYYRHIYTKFNARRIHILLSYFNVDYHDFEQNDYMIRYYDIDEINRLRQRGERSKDFMDVIRNMDQFLSERLKEKGQSLEDLDKPKIRTPRPKYPTQKQVEQMKADYEDEEKERERQEMLKQAEEHAKSFNINDDDTYVTAESRKIGKKRKKNSKKTPSAQEQVHGKVNSGIMFGLAENTDDDEYYIGHETDGDYSHVMENRVKHVIISENQLRNLILRCDQSHF